jgi:hypothetical protein
MVASAVTEFWCAYHLRGIWQGFALVLAGAALGAFVVMAGVDHIDELVRREGRR